MDSRPSKKEQITTQSSWLVWTGMFFKSWVSYTWLIWFVLYLYFSTSNEKFWTKTSFSKCSIYMVTVTKRFEILKLRSDYNKYCRGTHSFRNIHIPWILKSFTITFLYSEGVFYNSVIKRLFFGYFSTYF